MASDIQQQSRITGFMRHLRLILPRHNDSMPSVEVRDATDADLSGVLLVLAESGIDGGKSFSTEEAREHLARIRQWPNFRLLAAVIEGEVVGTYSLLIMEKL